MLRTSMLSPSNGDQLPPSPVKGSTSSGTPVSGQHPGQEGHCPAGRQDKDDHGSSARQSTARRGEDRMG